MFSEVQELAAEQAGYFAAAQAREWAGWRPQHLSYHVGRGNLERLRRGIYRIARYPHANDEELIVVWLWSGRRAVFSHWTALVRHGLSDLTANRLHVTLPPEWGHRRVRWPERVVPYHADLRDDDATWIGNVPATNAARTIADCVEEGRRPPERSLGLAPCSRASRPIPARGQGRSPVTSSVGCTLPLIH